jgi:hypothetical protein
MGNVVVADVDLEKAAQPVEIFMHAAYLSVYARGRWINVLQPSLCGLGI